METQTMKWMEFLMFNVHYFLFDILKAITDAHSLLKNSIMDLKYSADQTNNVSMSTYFFLTCFQ